MARASEGLAARGRTDDSEPLPGGELERDVLDHQALLSRRRHAQPLHCESSFRLRQRQRRLHIRQRREQCGEPPPALRAAKKPFQLAMVSSTGASARDTRIELAMMMPPVASG